MVSFPFGYGLSYSSFAFSDMKVEKSGEGLQAAYTLSVNVTNTGDRTGKEVVQLYVSDETETEVRPLKELKGFAKVELEPGETKTVAMELDYRSFAYYSTQLKDWFAPGGKYRILVGNSSANITLCEEIELEATKKLSFTVTQNTTIGELRRYPELSEIVENKIIPCLDDFSSGEDEETDAASEAISEEMSDAMTRYMPIRSIRSFGGASNGDMQKLIEELNSALKG